MSANETSHGVQPIQPDHPGEGFVTPNSPSPQLDASVPSLPPANLPRSTTQTDGIEPYHMHMGANAVMSSDTVLLGALAITFIEQADIGSFSNFFRILEKTFLTGDAAIAPAHAQLSMPDNVSHMHINSQDNVAITGNVTQAIDHTTSFPATEQLPYNNTGINLPHSSLTGVINSEIQANSTGGEGESIPPSASSITPTINLSEPNSFVVAQLVRVGQDSTNVNQEVVDTLLPEIDADIINAPVNVAPASPDVPTLVAADTTGQELQPIALNISAGLMDTDGSETLGINIAGIPLGGTLSAGTDNGDGSWALTPEELTGLTFTPPLGDLTYHFTVTATATENDGSTSAVSSEISVNVDPLNIIDGTNSANTISGTQHGDIIHGLNGADTISGLQGADILYGDVGNDRLSGGEGNDILYGGAGKDTLYGGAGNDTLSGGAGNNDEAYGEAGADTYLFALGDGKKDLFVGGNDAWIDTIQVEGAESVPNQPTADWTMEITNGATYTVDSVNQVIQFDTSATGHITLSDNSKLNFSEVEKITWS